MLAAMHARTIVTESKVIDDIMEPHQEALGLWYQGARNHAFRMLNFGRAFVPEEAHRDDRLAIMGAFHDLPVFLDGNFEYLGRAADWARDYLIGMGRADWEPEMRLMIMNHHKVRSYQGPSQAMVEAMRRADWIDVTFTKKRFGLDREFVRDVRVAFPINEAYKGLVMPAIGRYAVRHLTKPLPMMRW
jgi:hypothetical protein